MGVEDTGGTSKRRQAIIAVVALVAVVAIALVGYRLVASSAPAQPAAEPYELTRDPGAGFPAAEAVAACRLSTWDGESVELGRVIGGKPAVVNFWATWCPHCVREMGDFQRLYDEYGDRVQFVMADMVVGDVQEQRLARDFVEEGAYTMPVYFETEGELATLFGIRGLPTTAIVSADGQVLMNRAGAIKYDAMKATLDALLAA